MPGEYTDWYDEYYERISDDEELQKADDFRVLVGVSLTTQLIQNMVIHLSLTSLRGCLIRQPRKICLNTYLLIKSFNYHLDYVGANYDYS